jgi:hypothetical protein
MYQLIIYQYQDIIIQTPVDKYGSTISSSITKLNIDLTNDVHSLVTKANSSSLSVYDLKTEIILKSIIGNDSFVNLDSTFRIRINNVDTFTIQRFDNDGDLVSDAWMDLLKISYNTDTNNSLHL